MGTATAEDLLDARREALGAAEWQRARSRFEKARDLGESAEVLDRLSQAVHFQGEYDRAIELKERAFALYRRRGKRVEAAPGLRICGPTGTGGGGDGGGPAGDN